MDNYILQEIITSDGIYRWDYKSLANLPDLNGKLVEGDGISITHGETSDTVSLSPEASKKLDELYDAIFPVPFRLTGSTGFGIYEEGISVTPTISWSLGKLRSSGTSNVIASSSVDGNAWIQVGNTDPSELGTYVFPRTTSSKQYRLELKSGGSSSTIGPLSVTIGKYRYMGALDRAPLEVTESLIKSLSVKEINSDKTLSDTTLAKGQYFLFAAPGVFEPTVRDSGTGGIVDSVSDTIEIYRENLTSPYPSTYTWVLVPKSGMDWSFKIT